MSTTTPASINKVSALAISAKSDSAQLESLWNAVFLLICKWANDYHRNDETRLYEVRDLEQSGFLALCDAVEKFDPAKAQFTTLLRYFVRRRFAEVSGRRGSKRHPETYAVSLDEPLTTETETTRGDTIEDPQAEFAEDVIEQEAARQDATAMLKEVERLPDRQRESLMLTAWTGLTLSETGAKMGLSTEAVRRHRYNASQRLRRTKAGVQIARQRDCYRHHTTLAEFLRTRTSEPESYVLWLERQDDKDASYFW